MMPVPQMMLQMIVIHAPALSQEIPQKHGDKRGKTLNVADTWMVVRKDDTNQWRLTILQVNGTLTFALDVRPYYKSMKALLKV